MTNIGYHDFILHFYFCLLRVAIRPHSRTIMHCAYYKTAEILIYPITLGSPIETKISRRPRSLRFSNKMRQSIVEQTQRRAEARHGCIARDRDNIIAEKSNFSRARVPTFSLLWLCSRNRDRIVQAKVNVGAERARKKVDGFHDRFIDRPRLQRNSRESQSPVYTSVKVRRIRLNPRPGRSSCRLPRALESSRRRDYPPIS